jgi:hypothetical protein
MSPSRADDIKSLINEGCDLTKVISDHDQPYLKQVAWLISFGFLETAYMIIDLQGPHRYL